MTRRSLLTFLGITPAFITRFIAKKRKSRPQYFPPPRLAFEFPDYKEWQLKARLMESTALEPISSRDFKIPFRVTDNQAKERQ